MAKKKAVRIKRGQKPCPKCGKAIAARSESCSKRGCDWVKTKPTANKGATATTAATTPEPIAEPLGLDFYGDLIIRWAAHKLQHPDAKQKDYTNTKPVEGDWTTWSEADLTKNQEQQKQYKLGLDLLELTEDESKKLDAIAAELIAMTKE
jgi:hypothetical protein